MSSSDPVFHQATPEELLRLAAAITQRRDWVRVRDFVATWYGPEVVRIYIQHTGEYDDEGYGYGDWSVAMDDTPFEAFDAVGNPILPDFRLPAWADLDTQERAAEIREQLGIFTTRGVSDVEYELLEELVAMGVEERLQELRFELPERAMEVDLRTPPPEMGPIYIHQEGA